MAAIKDEFPVYRCMYISRRAAGSSVDTLKELHGQSREDNLERGVTGLLLSCEKYFLQVFEGRVSVIGHLMEKIYADERHSDVRLLFFRPADRRLFSGWGLALLPTSSVVNRSEATTRLVEALMAADPQDPDIVSRKQIEQLFVDFAGKDSKISALAPEL